MVDAAIERIAMERDASERDAERCSIERFAHEQQLAHYDYALDERGQPPSSQATRLRWKGLDVSEEFRDYAERIARGEDLPPFEGRVLAEPNAAFPWGSLSRGEPPAISSGAFTERPGRGGQLALWTSAAVVMALLSWSVALKVQAIDPPRALLDVAAKAADVPPQVDSLAAESAASGLSASGSSAGPVVEASAPQTTEQPSAALEAAALAQTAVPASEPVAAPPAAVVAPAAPSPAPAAAPSAAVASPAVASPGVATPAVASPAVASPAVAAGVAVSIAPAAAEPLAAAQPPVLAAPAVSAPTAAPAPAPKPTASPRQDAEMDFGIDELPLPSASTKGQVSETGNIGDLARVGQSGGSAARKEPGSESSAKGSLLVDKPSF